MEATEEMVVLQHKRERGPGEHILVNGVKYELDAEGCVEVPESAAAKLTAGAMWRTKEEWDAVRDQIADATPPPAAPGQGRRVRTKAELAAMAEVNGLPAPDVKGEEDDPKQRAIMDDDPEAQAAEAALQQRAERAAEGKNEVVEVSEDMTKAELLSLARDVGLKVNKHMTKSEILAAFDDVAE